jgi:glucan biosynthesis protein C
VIPTTPNTRTVMNEQFIYPQYGSSTGRTAGRRHDVDWLRVMAVLLLIPFHSAVIFNRYAEWYVTNETPSLALGAFAYFLSQWRMPILFFISGVGTGFALSSRKPWEHVRERAGRLLLPLAFGVLVIVPPQVYLWRRSDPGYELLGVLS